MKFAISYSCGKDSALALWRMISQGHEPVCLIVTFNSAENRSWFHGVTPGLLKEVQSVTDIPVIVCACEGKNYHTALEESLMRAKQMGAQACVFGDIDIEEHLAWNTQRCENVGLECIVPLWQQNREQVLGDALNAGIKPVIKCVQTDKLPTDVLGKTLDSALAKQLKGHGIDPCGENGEYHTFVYDAPMFSRPIGFVAGEVVNFGTHAAIELNSTDEATNSVAEQK